MPIQFDCPACGDVVRVSRRFAGKKGKCPRCQRAIVVPATGATQSGSDILPAFAEEEHAEPRREPRGVTITVPSSLTLARWVCIGTAVAYVLLLASSYLSFLQGSEALESVRYEQLSSVNPDSPARVTPVHRSASSFANALIAALVGVPVLLMASVGLRGGESWSRPAAVGGAVFLCVPALILWGLLRSECVQVYFEKRRTCPGCGAGKARLNELRGKLWCSACDATITLVEGR